MSDLCGNLGRSGKFGGGIESSHLSVVNGQHFLVSGMAAKREKTINDNEGNVLGEILLLDEAKGVSHAGSQDFVITEQRLTGNGKLTVDSGRELGIDELNGKNSDLLEKMNGGERSPEFFFENGCSGENRETPGLRNGDHLPENGWDSLSLSRDNRGEKVNIEAIAEMVEYGAPLRDLSFRHENGHVMINGLPNEEKSPENRRVMIDGLPYGEKSLDNGNPTGDRGISNETAREEEIVVVPHWKLPQPEPPRGYADPAEIRPFHRSQSEPSESASIGRFFRDRSSAILKRFSSSQSSSSDAIDDFNQLYLTGLKVTVHLKSESPSLQGRVTFFSRSGCRDCTAVRTFFTEKFLRFAEINLDVYPEREAELVRLTGSSIVPAVFFNEKFLGGLVALNSLRNSGQFDHRLLEMTAGRCPATAPAAPRYGFDGDEEEKPDELANIMRVLRHRLPIQDRLMRMKIVRNCFSGSEAVEELIHHLDCSRKKAVEVARQLAGRHFFHHAFQENEFEDGNHFYRLLEHEQFIQSCFNFRGTTNDEEPKPAVQVGKRLTKLMTAILESYTSDDRRHVDYVRIGTSEEFRRYVNLVQDLQRVDLSVLSVDERLAFFLNIYNAMVIHALIRRGRPEGVIDRLALFGEFSYIIGGHPYSLSAIRNGILRCNRRQPYSFARPFGTSDKRLQFALPKPNPLIHFGLCDGTKSSPRVRFFTAECIEAELRFATREFFREEGLEVDPGKRTVYFTKIIKWYSADFGQEKDLLNWVLNYLDATKADLLTHLLNDGSPLDIVYKNYDWSSNV